MICSTGVKIPILLSSGIFTASIGFLMYFIFPIIMNEEIKKRLVLKEGTESYKNWKDIPVPIYLHFYFFNVTNTEQIFNLTNKPVLQQLGPYTFREEREKVILSFNNNNTITYKQIRRWYFEPDKTVGSLDDIVTTLNVPMVSAASKAKQINQKFVYFTMEELFDYYQVSWFVHKPVRQLIFEGYDDPLMNFAKKFIDMPYDKFGWFYKRNGTDDGILNIFSGQNDIRTVDQIHLWNGNLSVSAFLPPCNMINGSAGDIWPPNLTTNSKVTMFVTDICRSVSFNYLMQVLVNGIRAYRYSADKTQLDNGKYDPRNSCFCNGGKCLPSGAVNVSACKLEAPVVVSFPHFLFADPVYNDGVIGLNPNPEEHTMYLDIVPEMGIPVRVAARMQINIVFEAVPKLSQFENITKRIYFPVFWFSETAVAGKDVSSQFNLVLNIIPTISKIFSLLTVFTGIILTCVSMVLILRLRWTLGRQMNSEISSEEETTILY